MEETTFRPHGQRDAARLQAGSRFVSAVLSAAMTLLAAVVCAAIGMSLG
ncbi:MAG: hypothetical protein AAF532_06880 [Planctomycetota bacterium]